MSRLLKGSAKAKNKPVPTDEAGQIAILQSAVATESTSQTKTSETVVVEETQSEDRNQRQEDLEAAAELLNTGTTAPIVTSEMILEACKSEKPVSAITKEWTEKAPESKLPDANGTSVKVVTEAIEKKSNGLLAAMCYKAGIHDEEKLTAIDESKAYQDMRSMRMVDMAGMLFDEAGVEIEGHGYKRDENIAKRFIQGESGEQPHDKTETALSGLNLNETRSSSAISVNRPADTPLITNRFVDIMFDEGMMTSTGTFDQWCGRGRDFRDLTPQQWGAVAKPRRLDELIDDETFKQIKFEEEILGHIEINHFGNKVVLNERTILSDTMNKFMEQIMALGEAARETVHDLCMKQLVSRETMVFDNERLFSDARVNPNNPAQANYNVNLIDPGGPPSPALQRDIDLLFQRMYAPGSDSKRMRGQANVILVPPEQFDAAEKSFLPTNRLMEMLWKQDATQINQRRRDVRIIQEPDLEDYSTDLWYAFTGSDSTAPIQFSYLSGYGERGRRQQWLDYDRRSRCYSIDMWATAGVKNYRGGVQVGPYPA